MVPVLRPRSRLLRNLRQPHRPRQYHMAMVDCLLLLAGVRARLHFLPLPRDSGPYARGVVFLYVSLLAAFLLSHANRS